MTDPETRESAAEPNQLQTRVQELEHERKLLLAVVDILQDISGTLHFVDILQVITRKLVIALTTDHMT